MTSAPQARSSSMRSSFDLRLIDAGAMRIPAGRPSQLGLGTSRLPWSMPGRSRIRSDQTRTLFRPGSDRFRNDLNPFLGSGEA